jgi:hypothetical protein
MATRATAVASDLLFAELGCPAAAGPVAAAPAAGACDAAAAAAAAPRAFASGTPANWGMNCCIRFMYETLGADDDIVTMRVIDFLRLGAAMLDGPPVTAIGCETPTPAADAADGPNSDGLTSVNGDGGSGPPSRGGGSQGGCFGRCVGAFGGGGRETGHEKAIIWPFLVSSLDLAAASFLLRPMLIGAVVLPDGPAPDGAAAADAIELAAAAAAPAKSCSIASISQRMQYAHPFPMREPVMDPPPVQHSKQRSVQMPKMQMQMHTHARAHVPDWTASASGPLVSATHLTLRVSLLCCESDCTGQERAGSGRDGVKTDGREANTTRQRALTIPSHRTLHR